MVLRVLCASLKKRAIPHEMEGYIDPDTVMGMDAELNGVNAPPLDRRGSGRLLEDLDREELLAELRRLQLENSSLREGSKRPLYSCYSQRPLIVQSRVRFRPLSTLEELGSSHSSRGPSPHGSSINNGQMHCNLLIVRNRNRGRLEGTARSCC